MPQMLRLTTNQHQTAGTATGSLTVTYMLQGGITHQDSAGHKGTIGPCDVQVKTYFEYVGKICCILRSFMRNKDGFFLVKTYFEYVGKICCVLRSFMRNKDGFFFGLICIEFPLFTV
ncbi:uncharacterized protein LOC126699278 [Quercus robur]|uniref:uncharacterized protein LOC126699278 n=1 Tax=Quercus robur TaxID=38942 RepID=UPI0021618F8D|nr:uncharacterized protein LOC126699278 [Quercus robur]